MEISLKKGDLMRLTEAFAELDLIYAPPKKDLNESRSMPYALLVLLDGEWKVYKGLDFELTDDELVGFLSDKPEYTDAKVIPAADIQKYVQSKPLLKEDGWLSREELIAELEKLGYKYKFDKYSDGQLYSILEKTKAKIESDKALAELEQSRLKTKPICDSCGSALADSGICPKCYDGATDLDEGVFDRKLSNMTSWKTTSGTQSSTVSGSNSPKAASSAGKKIVTIFYDTKARKLRAQADDGINGVANVAFPNHLRNQAGQQYEVDDLIWNGKNYRVSGDIKPVSSVANTQNINENTNKENYEMNFQTILEELDRIYEELPAEETIKKEADEVAEVSEACDKALTEDSDEEVLIDDEPIVEDEAEEEVAEEEPKQLVLECSKCGALAIRAEADVKVEEETDLANVEDACQYCEETAGYTIAGVLTPYEAEETVAEALTEGKVKDSLKKLSTRLGAEAATTIRAIGEVISDVLPEKQGDALYDAVTNLENKATLQALMNGNEKVLNGTTVADLEELKKDIEEYKKAKESKVEESVEVEEGLFDKREEKTIKVSELKKGDKVVALDGDKFSRPSTVKEIIKRPAGGYDVHHRDGSFSVGPDTEVIALVK